MATIRDQNYRKIYTISPQEEKLLLSLVRLNLPTYSRPEDTPMGLHYLIKNVIRPIMRRYIDQYFDYVWTDVQIRDEKLWEITYFIDEVDPSLESLMIEDHNEGTFTEWYVYA